MKTYQFTKSFQGKVFIFFSVGLNGVIKKVVQFQELRAGLVYNAALADEKEGILHYETESNNGDIFIIFNTFALILERFYLMHPGIFVFITGNDKRRIKTYQWRLDKAFQELGNKYSFFGQKEDGSPWEVFQRSESYTAFLVIHCYNLILLIMKTINNIKKYSKIKVDKSLDKYENYPLPAYKTERAMSNLESAIEVVKKLREKMDAEKSNKASRET